MRMNNKRKAFWEKPLVLHILLTWLQCLLHVFFSSVSPKQKNQIKFQQIKVLIGAFTIGSCTSLSHFNRLTSKKERENENEKSSSVHCHSCRMWSNSHVALNSIFPLVFRKLKSNNSGWKQTTRNKQPKRCKRENKKNPNDKPNRFKTSDTTADYRKRKKWWEWVDAPCEFCVVENRRDKIAYIQQDLRNTRTR